MGEHVGLLEVRKMARRLAECGLWQALEKAGRVNGRPVHVEEKNRTDCQQETVGMQRADPDRGGICEKGGRVKRILTGSFAKDDGPSLRCLTRFGCTGLWMRGRVRLIMIIRSKAQ